MNLTLKIWRQKGPQEKGKLVDYKVNDISGDMSFLEMMDVVNEQLINSGDEPVAFDHDCREGICGMCSLYINGEAHGPDRGVTTCQLHMRSFKDGDTIYIEPFRAAAFPVIKDLVIAYNKQEVLFQLTLQEIRRMLMQYLFLNTTQIKPWMLLLVSVVVLVWLLVKTLQRCYLLEQKFRNMHYYHKDKLKLQIVC